MIPPLYWIAGAIFAFAACYSKIHDDWYGYFVMWILFSFMIYMAIIKGMFA